MPFFSRVVLPLFLLLYIAVETYLKLQHSTLCEQTGCKLAGELLNFNALYLNYFGMAGLGGLMLTGWLSLKRKTMQNLFYALLYAGVAFESVMIAYQFYANPTLCSFCLGIWGGLLFTALLSAPKKLLFAMPAIVSLFVSLGSLSIVKNKSFVTQDGTYLIYSESCPHCKKVKQYFAQNSVAYTAITVQSANARAFLKFLDIGTIPVLIIKDKTQTTILKGDTQIIAHYQAKNSTLQTAKTVTAAPIESSAPQLSSDFLGASQEEGCSITITETPSCEGDDITPFGAAQ